MTRQSYNIRQHKHDGGNIAKNYHRNDLGGASLSSQKKHVTVNKINAIAFIIDKQIYLIL